jgi:DedD protein
LRHELSQNQLISDAVIFAGQEGGPITLVSYQPQITQPDFRPPLQDETIAGGKPEAIPYRSESQNQQPEVARLDGVNKQSMAPPVEKKAPSVPASQLETENKSAWSKRALAHDSQPAAVQAKPVAKTSAEAEKAPGVRPQPLAREAGARIGSPATTVPETKSVAGQITVANKPVPEAQAKKTEPSTMSSNKSPAEAKAMRSPATAQREKAFGMNKNQESATSGIQQVEGAPSNSDKKTEALGKITLSDAARLKSQPVAVNAGSEQIALVRKQTGETAATVKPSQARKTLEGYVIQAVFEHKADAQRWAEKIERRGYTVSLTETGGASVRLRVGSFALREEADRQLRALKQEGLTGIILNLPQPYRSAGGVAAAAEAAKATPIQE